MILSAVVVSLLIMVTTWPSAVQNCSVLVPTQPTGSKPRGKHEVITSCVKEMNPCWYFCNIRSFCSTLSFSCEGNCWLSWSYTVLNDCAYHLFSSEASYVLIQLHLIYSYLRLQLTVIPGVKAAWRQVSGWVVNELEKVWKEAAIT
jgi:hypothetical protein